MSKFKIGDLVVGCYSEGRRTPYIWRSYVGKVMLVIGQPEFFANSKHPYYRCLIGAREIYALEVLIKSMTCDISI